MASRLPLAVIALKHNITSKNCNNFYKYSFLSVMIDNTASRTLRTSPEPMPIYVHIAYNKLMNFHC